MQTGRRDGMVSDKSLAEDMPDVNDSIQTLKAKFVSKGLNDKDLVVLSGNTALSFYISDSYGYGVCVFVCFGKCCALVQPASINHLILHSKVLSLSHTHGKGHTCR